MAKKNKLIDLNLDVTGVKMNVQQIRGQMQGLEQTLSSLQAKLAACFGGGLLAGWLWQSIQKSGELGGALSHLQSAFDRLSDAIGTALAPVARSVLELLSGAVTEAAKLVSYFGEILQVFFGTDKAVQTVTASQKKLTTATKATAKALQRSLMGFDQINRLQKKTGSTGSTGTSKGSTSAKSVSREQTLPKLDLMQKSILELINQFAEGLRSIDFSSVIKYLGLLYEGIKPHVPTLYAGLKFFWEEILIPLAKWTVEEAVPQFLKLLTVAVQSLATMIEVFKPALTWLWEKFLVPLGQWAGETLLNALDWLMEKMVGITNWAIDHRGLATVLAVAVAALVGKLLNCNSALGNLILFGGNGASQMNLLSIAMGVVKTAVGAVVAAVAALSAAALTLGANWDKVKAGAVNAWQGVKNAWQGVSGWFQEKVLTPLRNGFRTTANGIIGFVNGILKGISAGINAVIKAINGLSFTLPQWIPGLGGKSLGFHLKTMAVPQIPYLAKGAVLPANKPFLAMVGDQKHGTNVEAPLATIQEAVAVVMQEYLASNMAGHEATVAVLREILEAVLGISIGDDVIAAAVSRHNARLAVLKGGQT